MEAGPGAVSHSRRNAAKKRPEAGLCSDLQAHLAEKIAVQHGMIWVLREQQVQHLQDVLASPFDADTVTPGEVAVIEAKEAWRQGVQINRIDHPEPGQERLRHAPPCAGPQKEQGISAGIPILQPLFQPFNEGLPRAAIAQRASVPQETAA